MSRSQSRRLIYHVQNTYICALLCTNLPVCLGFNLMLKLYNYLAINL